MHLWLLLVTCVAPYQGYSRLLFPVLLGALTASPPPFLQGTLLFCLLLLAIWAPLLLFSSGAPTYQTPGIVEVRANASFGVTTSYGHYQGASVPASYLYW